MAILFELWAETDNEAALQRFIEHFAHHQFTLINGRAITCEAGPAPEYPLAAIVYSEGLSRDGVRSLSDALETTETGLRLFKHLRSAPEFSFARIDWEAGNIPMADLKEYVEMCPDGRCTLNLPCVVSETLYRELGSPKFFESFREGYLWYRYQGESYQPLYSTDQRELNDLCRQLFPGEYFKY